MMEYLYLGWFILGVFLLVIEIATINFFTLWFAIGSFFAGVLALFNVGNVWQVVGFTVLSTILVIFTRPFAKKIMGKSPKEIYIDDLVNKKGRVIEDVNMDINKGLVKLDEGETWRAQPINEDEKIAKGREVIVRKHSGNFIFVEEINKKGE